MSNIDKIAEGIENIPTCLTLENAKTHVTQVFVDVFGKEFNLSEEGANMLFINAVSKALYKRESRIIRSNNAV